MIRCVFRIALRDEVTWACICLPSRQAALTASGHCRSMTNTTFSSITPSTVLRRHEEQGSEAWRGRVAHNLRSGRGAKRSGAARELVAAANGRFLAICASLLAEAAGPRRLMDTTASCEGRMTPPRGRSASKLGLNEWKCSLELSGEGAPGAPRVHPSITSHNSRDVRSIANIPSKNTELE